jgi:uncharacterized protein GlcG (DUF336 family)
MNTKVLHRRALFAVAVGAGIVTAASAAQAASGVDCPVTYQALKQKLQQAAAQDQTGFPNNHYWGVVVNRAGVVCAVAFSGPEVDAQWLLSRQIAAAKAFTANGLSLDGAPISSGQLYASVQPGAAPNPLFGLHFGNPVDPEAAYKGKNLGQFGAANDPMVGERVGGTITFGGGFGLYNGSNAVGGVGLSGNTACADHSTAWRLRALLGLAPATGDDRITLDDALDDFGDHPRCPNDAGTQGAIIPPG